MVPERTHSRANPARGVALIATAVIVGFFVLRNGLDQNTPIVSSANTEAPADGAATTAPPPGSETTASTAPLRPPAEVSVRVLNASGVGGAAGDWSSALAADGYQMIEAGNAPETNREATAVLFAPGFDREAGMVAQAMGAPADGVAAIGEPPTAEANGANIVVLLGTDIASSAPEA